MRGPRERTINHEKVLSPRHWFFGPYRGRTAVPSQCLQGFCACLGGPYRGRTGVPGEIEEKAEEGRKILGQKDKGGWKREFFDWGPNNSLFQHWVSPKNI